MFKNSGYQEPSSNLVDESTKLIAKAKLEGKENF